MTHIDAVSQTPSPYSIRLGHLPGPDARLGALPRELAFAKVARRCGFCGPE